MNLVPLYFDGDVTAGELREALTAGGFHVRVDAAGRMVASRIPAFLRRESPALADVIPIIAPLIRPKGARRA